MTSLTPEDVFSTQDGSTGWHPSPHDWNDRYYRPNESVKVRPQVNLRDDYPQAKIPVYDQESTQSCVANATAAALWYEIKKSGDDTIGPNGPSRLFIYYTARVRVIGEKRKAILSKITDKTDIQALEKELAAIPKLSDSGTNNRAALKCLDSIGACPEETFSWEKNNVDTEPFKKCYEEAQKHTIRAYYRLDPDKPNTDTSDPHIVKKLDLEDKTKTGLFLLDKFKQCLSEGYPVILGIRQYANKPKWVKEENGIWTLKDIWSDDNEPKQQRHTKPGEPGPVIKYPGHSVIAIGYDDEKQAALIQNSVGVNKNDWDSAEGLFWLPYVWITDYYATYDFWTLRTHRSPLPDFWFLGDVLEQVEQIKLDAQK